MCVYNIQSTPDNSNLQGKPKIVRDSGNSSYREFEVNNRNYKEMGWGMNSSNKHTSKFDKYSVLDTVFKLD